MNVRKIVIIVIAAICVLCLAYGIYYQVFEANEEEYTSNVSSNNNVIAEAVDFDSLFDNSMNYQGYSVNNDKKSDQTKDLVYTTYYQNENYVGKYDMEVSIPVINLNSSSAASINKEISSIFYDKVTSIMEATENEYVTVYTVEYTAYLNENILSIVIKSTLKEGDSAQRVIIKAYTYNISTNEEISLASMLEIKGKDTATVEKEIKRVIQESISSSDNLAALGYTVYERDINSSIYTVENSNNYFLGPDGAIYIIYAYGNSSYTSEKDVVVIQ